MSNVPRFYSKLSVNGGLISPATGLDLFSKLIYWVFLPWSQNSHGMKARSTKSFQCKQYRKPLENLFEKAVSWTHFTNYQSKKMYF